MQRDLMESNDLPFNVSRVRVRMYHTDLVGAVFHGRIFDLFEEARTEAFRRLGFEWRVTDSAGIGMVVTDVQASFAKPALMDDAVQIAVYVDDLRTAQVRITYEGRRDADGALLFTGSTNFAFVDRERGRPVRVPQPLLDAIHRCPDMLRGRRHVEGTQRASGTDVRLVPMPETSKPPL